MNENGMGKKGEEGNINEMYERYEMNVNVA